MEQDIKKLAGSGLVNEDVIGALEDFGKNLQQLQKAARKLEFDEIAGKAKEGVDGYQELVLELYNQVGSAERKYGVKLHLNDQDISKVEKWEIDETKIEIYNTMAEFSNEAVKNMDDLHDVAENYFKEKEVPSPRRVVIGEDLEFTRAILNGFILVLGMEMKNRLGQSRG